jgi:hypothetical protein
MADAGTAAGVEECSDALGRRHRHVVEHHLGHAIDIDGPAAVRVIDRRVRRADRHTWDISVLVDREAADFRGRTADDLNERVVVVVDASNRGAGVPADGNRPVIDVYAAGVRSGANDGAMDLDGRVRARLDGVCTADQLRCRRCQATDSPGSSAARPDMNFRQKWGSPGKGHEGQNGHATNRAEREQHIHSFGRRFT